MILTGMSRASGVAILYSDVQLFLFKMPYYCSDNSTFSVPSETALSSSIIVSTSMTIDHDGLAEACSM